MPITINDELTRIEGAKADIATAIGSKGVNVPANAKIDDFANLIDAIQTGGGSPNLQSKSVSITTNGTTNVVADSGYDGLSNVDVGVNVASFENDLKCMIERDGNITVINIPNTTTKIGDYAFQGCSSLTLLHIPDTVQSIGVSGIRSCTSLEKIDIPSSVLSFGTNAFNGCTSLGTIVLRGTTLKTLSHAFNVLASTKIANRDGGYVYVPDDLVTNYRTKTNWSNYADVIKGWHYDANNNTVDEDNNIIVNADGTFPTT